MDEVKLLPCEGALKRVGDRLKKVGQHGFATLRVSDLRAIYALATRPPIGTDEVVKALAVARADLNHLGEKYGMQEFVAPTICRLSAALAAMPAIDQDGGE